MSSEQSDTFSPHNLMVLGGLLFVALILGEFVFSKQANQGVSIDPTLGPGTRDEIAMRLKPVVMLEDLLANAGSGAADLAQQTPEQLYQGACLACHASGVAGAPKTGDNAVWQDRMGVGLDALVSSAITGKGAMPPNGGSAYSEEQMRLVIEYILAESGL